jgi:hypothetical protein
MVEKIEDAIERNWRLIIGIVGMMISIFGGIFMVTSPMQRDISEMRAEIRELRAAVSGNFQRIEEFRARTEGNRYTAQDAARDMDRIWDAIRRVEQDGKEDRLDNNPKRP